MLLTFSSASGETLDNLVKRDGLWYKKFTNIPFSGEINEGIARGNVEDGKLTGEWEFYLPDGQLEVKVHVKNGLRNGSAEYYWDNGQLNAVGEYKNNRKEGTWSHYFDNGKLKGVGDYRNGKKEGTWKYYDYETSKLSDKIHHKNGVYHGLAESYYDNGRVDSRTTYVDGTLEDQRNIITKVGNCGTRVTM